MIRLNLERRIVVVFVGLVLAVLLLMLLIVQRTGAQIVDAESQRRLAVGRASFETLLEQNRRQLELAATVLSGDFSFREAIATQDRATMHSVLQNHGSRIGASAMMVVSLDGHVLVDTQRPRDAGSAFEFPQLLAAADAPNRGSDVIRMADGRIYQVVVVGILAPVRIAWVVMGFNIDDAWAHNLGRASGLDVALIDSVGSVVAARSVTGIDDGLLAGATAVVDVQRRLDAGERHFHSVALPMGGQARVLLLHSVENSEAVFHALERTLAVTAGGGILLFVIGSLLLARRIATPVNALAKAADAMARGDYSHPVAVAGGDEIAQLAAGFESMRKGIAAREAKITRLAYEDALTELPNRARLEERFAMLPAGARATILVLDLDRFAAINNALGHPVGDRLLQRVTLRLVPLLPPGVLLVRLWGDEFAFLMPDADRAQVRAFIDTLLTAMAKPTDIDGQRLDVGGTLGIAEAPDDGRDINTLLQGAERAMYEAKHRQCGFMFAADVGPGPSPADLSLIGEMRDALRDGQFVLHYQPKLALAGRHVTGAESLLRWQHPDRGLVPPGRFIPFAEQTGFIREITPWLIGEVCEQAARWREQGRELTLSANLSARDLLDRRLVGTVRHHVERCALPPQALCLEITESALMEDPDIAQATLAELADYGVRLSIDDYGAGQASLAYVKSLPVHELKIDQSFIRSLASSPKDAAIVRSTIALGHALDLSVVAEGIETADDLEWLGAVACDGGQGYFIARPLAADAFAGWFDQRVAGATKLQ